jgi:hypothetical protein
MDGAYAGNPEERFRLPVAPSQQVNTVRPRDVLSLDGEVLAIHEDHVGVLGELTRHQV